MSRSALFFVFCLSLGVLGVASARAQTPKEGIGLNSQILWSTPGPQNFAFVQSADVIGHQDVTFSVVTDYYRKPLGLEIGNNTYWSVKRVTAMDFAWAVGLMDRFQIGMVLPVIIEQAGAGSSPLLAEQPVDSDPEIADAAVGDIRFHAKTLFYQQHPTSDDRGAGIALDVGLSVPSGDEENFAGEKGIVWAPALVLDFHRKWISAGANIGVRLRSGEKPGLANSVVGNQLSYGLGLTFHMWDDKLLLGAETTSLAEIDDFDRIGMELRGVIGSRPGQTKSVTLWLSGSAGLANPDDPLLSVPQMRFTFGISYTPSADSIEPDIFL